jgi:transcriptional regulator with XRE-family HTH domain
MVKIEKNAALKMAVFLSGKTLKRISEETGIARMYLSQAQHGKYILNDEQRDLIANCLNRPVEEVFSN